MYNHQIPHYKKHYLAFKTKKFNSIPSILKFKGFYNLR